MVVGQNRLIEKRGTLILTEEERLAYYLQILVLVEQKNSGRESRNLKLNPPRGFYGWMTYFSDIWVIKEEQIKFYNQVAYEYFQENLQYHLVESANIEVLSDALNAIAASIPSPPDVIIIDPFPTEPTFLPLSKINFVLEDGVVIRVLTNYVPLYVPPDLEVEGQEPPKPPGDNDRSENPPVEAPPPGSPPNTGQPGSEAPFELSPPYDGIDDDGDTYVPPPGWEGDLGDDPLSTYDVRWQRINAESGTIDDDSTTMNLPGPIRGLGTPSPNDPSAQYGIRYGNNQYTAIISNYLRGVGRDLPDGSYVARVRIVSVYRSLP